MPRHVALLRAVNVGGRKLEMAELRRVISELGHDDVTTYIQTGNILFRPESPDAPAAALAAQIEAAIERSFGLHSTVIVLSRDDLAGVVSANPYPDAAEPRFVHVVFLPGDPDDSVAPRVAELVAKAAAAGGRDLATLRGRALYLHTPDGFGRSDLARSVLLARGGPVAHGTARNWSTVTKLLALCDET